MDRELLIEIGCEELPASWLPTLTRQLGEAVKVRLAEARLATDAPVEAYSTPRRLTVCNPRVSERQTDLEELLTGPPVSAAFDASGEPSPAAAGFARKQGVEVALLERVDTPKGTYLAFRKKQRGKPAVDVLPDVLGAALRDLSFPKAMRWDAWLDDGRGELLFGRPIRWILFLYGGRVVPFEIRRSERAQSPQVQDVRSAAVTYGHRFLTTSGRAGRAIKVRSFDDYRARLLENFVVLDRAERQDRIARELEAKARKLNGRVAFGIIGRSPLLDEVPDLIEYPSVMAGFVHEEFLKLPPEVWTTTLVHHQHYFPVVDEAGHLKNAFLAVTNTDSANERIVARNAERVVTARLRDARFFWEADRRMKLEERIDRLDTILFHKKLGTYRDKAKRIASLAQWVAAEALGAPDAAEGARRAGELAKADLATDMVREFTELQGTIGGIYAREEGQSEAVWKAIYYHYLPVAIEPDSPPSRQELGAAAVTWAAVSLADKLDTLVGMIAGVGELPTGTRDPFGLRRQAQGLVRLLTDLPELTGLDKSLELGQLFDRSFDLFRSEQPLNFDTNNPHLRLDFMFFMSERLRHLFRLRGFTQGEIQAVFPEDDAGSPAGSLRPLQIRRRLGAIREMRGSEDFEALAELFKRTKNISKDVTFDPGGWADLVDYANKESSEAAEKALIHEVAISVNLIHNAKIEERYLDALKRISMFRPQVARYFDEVLVMANDERVRRNRLRLMAGLRDLVMEIADISQLAPQAESQTALRS